MRNECHMSHGEFHGLCEKQRKIAHVFFHLSSEEKKKKIKFFSRMCYSDSERTSIQFCLMITGSSFIYQFDGQILSFSIHKEIVDRNVYPVYLLCRQTRGNHSNWTSAL